MTGLHPSQAASGTRSRVRWFLVVAALIVAGDLWAIRQLAAVTAAVNERTALAQDATGAADVEDLSARDPVLGAPLPGAGVGRTIRAKEAPSGRGYILVALTSCTSCGKFDLVRWTADCRKAGVRLVTVTSGPLEEAVKPRQSAAGERTFYQDPDSALQSALNAWWSGRVYYFDAGWRLRWMSAFNQADHHLVELQDLQAAMTQTREGRR